MSILNIINLFIIFVTIIYIIYIIYIVQIKCATDDNEINLSSLIKSTDNYIIKVNKTEFHINICRPLVPISGLTCIHGSAICKTSINSNNEYVNETVSKYYYIYIYIYLN